MSLTLTCRCRQAFTRTGRRMNSRDDARQRLQSQLCHELGEPILDALAQRGVSDVKIRADGILTIKRLGQWTDDLNAYYPPERRETIIGLVADSLHRVVTFDTPSVEGEFVLSMGPSLQAFPLVGFPSNASS